MTHLEEFTILKGGASVIIANQSEELNWSSLLLNYLLISALKNQKYEVLCVIHPGGKISELHTLLKLSSCDHYLENGRLRFLGSLNEFQIKVDSGQIKLADSQSVAIFLYPLDGDLLGVENSKFLRELICLTEDGERNGGEASQVLLLATLEFSVHSDFRFLRSFFPTTITIVPNDGTLAKKVCCQTQVVRRSSTNKVQEYIELFSFRRAGILLEPISTSVSSDSRDHAQSRTSMVPSGVKIPSTIPQSNAASVVQPRLISFESTDPEFDEDSDPDADLDL